MSDETTAERVRPWAGCLHMMRHMVAHESTKGVPFGEMLKYACEQYKVPYPPDDIAFTILRLAMQWSMQGVPVPQDEGC